jgi:aminopeptidase
MESNGMKLNIENNVYEYQPSREILDKYSDVLVNFALDSCRGIKKGDVVLLQVPECAKPMLISLRRAVLKAGGHPMIQYLPDDFGKEFYEIADDDQLVFFPEKYLRGKVDEIDHSIMIIADKNKHELSEIDPKKIMIRNESWKPYKDWRNEKENKGEFTWTLALYGVKEMADEVGMTLKEYWDEIIKACYLDEENPVEKWKEIVNEVDRVKDRLNELKIKELRVRSIGNDDIDLVVGIDSNREWMGGSGRNIPSFEVFISPDYRVTSGKIRFNKPLYRYGNLIEDVKLEFKDGKVVSASASKGENLLKEMIAVKGADQIGEFSLTDSRLSRITKFMGETLFDENVGGEFGNTHIALGSSYHDSFPGDPSKVSKEEWEEMGYNDSSVHTDIVSTEDREVTAVLEDGSEMVIYKNGEFVV